MDRQERRSKFHDAIINMLHPSPPSMADQAQSNTLNDIKFDVNLIPDPEDVEENCSSSSSDDDDEQLPVESEKLSRSQRKRIRKKKIKESTSERRKIIGPLMPSIGIHDETERCPENVRRNASEKECTDEDIPTGPKSRSKKRLKQRRMTKKLAKERLKTSQEKKFDEHHEDEV